MKIHTADWRSRLRAALDDEAAAAGHALTDEDILAMRRAVVAAARDAAPGGRWRRPLALAAAACLTIGVGAVVGRRFEAHGPPAPGAVGGSAPQLQLQFATPGGTRIIWVFNADLDLKAAKR